MPVDLAALEANRPAKIPACYRNRPPCETLMRQLLRLKLYNPTNVCYINAALMGQLWATLAYEGFDPELWGQWRKPLLELLDTPSGADLSNSVSFSSLLQPWFDEHNSTEQQDAAEFLGWLRGQHLYGHVWGMESNGWQTGLANSMEDRGALLAPLLLRVPEEEKRCDLQVLINMWHGQDPFTNACIHAHPCIVLQIERFPALGLKRDTPVDFSRAEVHVPVFNHPAGRDVSWLQYRVVAILCHFGDDPDSGHYQCLFVSSGSSWMTDDGKEAIRCPVVDPIRRTAYLFWIVPQDDLNLWWRRPIEDLHTDLSDLLATAFSGVAT